MHGSKHAAAPIVVDELTTIALRWPLWPVRVGSQKLGMGVPSRSKHSDGILAAAGAGVPMAFRTLCG